MKFILRILIVGAAVFALPYVLPGIVVEGWQAALAASAVLAVINLFIKPLITILTLPLTIITLGLFGLVVNGLLFLLVAWLVPGFGIESFVQGLVGALIISLVNWIISKN